MGSSGTSCRTGPRASTKYLDISDYSGDLLGFLVSYRPLAAKCLLGQSVAGSKMYISAVTIAEFLIVVVIIMSLPKLVTS